MKIRLFGFIGMLCALSVPTAYGQILGQNLKVFVGYSNLQGEGFLNRNTPSGVFDNEFFRDRTTLHGANLEITGAAHGIGITGDFSFNRNRQHSDFIGGSNAVNTDVYYFMAGPSFQSNGPGRLEPFARILAGGAHTRFDVNHSENVSPGVLTNSFEAGSTSFAMGIGGGLDLRLGDGPYRLRLIQLDYAPIFLRDKSVEVLGAAGAIQPATLSGQRQDNLRLSVGFVF